VVVLRLRVGLLRTPHTPPFLIHDGDVKRFSTIFQQDNASCHVSKKTRDWFDKVMTEYGFSVMDWPPNSLDMNLIENL